ncbi:AAA family ATPase [Elizabethkingia miricola]|uniref:AAA family ATPase n=1 Tax=Elizabethkingia miricola TaxID=172045 RepID=UPI003892054B
MRINTLELTNVRGFTHAKLDFQPGFNLIVGINGVGKTTVLETLRVSLTHILKEIKSPIITSESFKKSDININTDQLHVNTSFTIDKHNYDFIYSKSAKDYTTISTEQKKRTKESTANVREEGITLEDIIEFKPEIKRTGKNPELGLFFSTRRSLLVNQALKVVKSGLSNAAAYVDALSETRAFNVKMFAEWFKVRKELAKVAPEQIKTIQLIEQTIYTFLPGFSDLDLVEDEISKELTFCITKSKKVLNFNQLSDGERGILALVFDIARRLIIAYMHNDNPLEGEAVILIDELDLHLHPKWQRTIVSDLQRTFPNCQFIATTHSPQIIGEVKPEAITIIDKNYEKEVYKPHVAFGLDTQRILEELLDTPIRNTDINKEFIKLNKSVDDEKFAEAKKLISELKKILGDYDPELIRINSMIQFLEEDLEDEKDS